MEKINTMDAAAILAGAFITREFKPKKDAKYIEFAQKLREDGVWLEEGGLAPENDDIDWEIILREMEKDVEEARISREIDWRGRRGDRRRETKKARKRRKNIAKYSYSYIIPKTGKVKNLGIKGYEKGDKLYTNKTRRTGREICRKYEEDETILLLPSYDEDVDGYWDSDDLQEFIPESEMPAPVKMPEEDPGYSAYIIHFCGGAWEDYYNYQYIVFTWDKCCRKATEIYNRVLENKEEYSTDFPSIYIVPAKIEDDEVVEINRLILEHRLFKN